MFVDSHLHLDSFENIDEVINNAKERNVKYLIVSCCSMDEIENGLKFINKYDNVFFSIGLHPSEANKYSKQDLEKITQIIKQYRNKIIAVGEIGLDYYYGKDNVEKQRQLFDLQLQLAEHLNLPVVIHTRDATADTIDILKSHSIKGVIHCFNGSIETANIYIKMGFKLGLGGVLTFKNTKLPCVTKKIDLSNIILETDSPYLAPVPLRGSINEPKNIPIIAEKLAQIKEISISEVASITTNNVINLFDLKKWL